MFDFQVHYVDGHGTCRAAVVLSRRPAQVVDLVWFDPDDGSTIDRAGCIAGKLERLVDPDLSGRRGPGTWHRAAGCSCGQPL